MVKVILKRNNVLLSQFASDLNISRPTLDAYIKNFDNNKPISNPLYQKIFDFLFSSITISNEEFREKYNHVLKSFKDPSYNTLYMSSIENIVSNGDIKNHLSLSECNTLGDLITQNDALLLHLLKINQILANDIPLDTLSEKEKMLTVGLYDLSNKLNDGDYSYNYESYLKLERAVNKKNSLVSNDEIKKQLFNQLSSAIEKAVDNGDSEALAKLISSISGK